MNSLQIRKEAITLMQKLRGIYWSMMSYLAFQNGESISMYPFLALSGNNWITLFVPSARIWTHQGIDIKRM